MYFRFLIDDATGCASYLLADSTQREAVIIDPRFEDMAVLHSMLDEQSLNLTWVIRTHHHAADKALTAMDWPLPPANLIDNAVQPNHPTELRFGSQLLRLISTPGHTATCISCVWRDRVFCGGLLAADACPHQSWPAKPASLWDSVTREIFTLPNETLLFSGHSRAKRLVSTVQEQRSTHPWFAGNSRDEFLSRFTPHSGVKPLQPFLSVTPSELSNVP